MIRRARRRVGGPRDGNVVFSGILMCKNLSDSELHFMPPPGMHLSLYVQADTRNDRNFGGTGSKYSSPQNHNSQLVVSHEYTIWLPILSPSQELSFARPSSTAVTKFEQLY